MLTGVSLSRVVNRINILLLCHCLLNTRWASIEVNCIFQNIFVSYYSNKENCKILPELAQDTFQRTETISTLNANTSEICGCFSAERFKECKHHYIVLKMFLKSSPPNLLWFYKCLRHGFWPLGGAGEGSLRCGCKLVNTFSWHL